MLMTTTATQQSFALWRSRPWREKNLVRAIQSITHIGERRVLRPYPRVDHSDDDPLPRTALPARSLPHSPLDVDERWGMWILSGNRFVPLDVCHVRQRLEKAHLPGC